MSRFRVGTVTGYEGIGPHGPRNVHLTAHVLDSAYAYRVVAAFRSDYLHRGSLEANYAATIANAEATAADWNDWDADPTRYPNPGKHGIVRMIERGCTCRRCITASSSRNAALLRRANRRAAAA